MPMISIIVAFLIICLQFYCLKLSYDANDLHDLINECSINTLYKHKMDVNNIINSLESELDKLIMKKHYLNYETGSKISEDLSITYQIAHAHHKKSIETLEKFYKKKKMQ